MKLSSTLSKAMDWSNAIIHGPLNLQTSISFTYKYAYTWCLYIDIQLVLVGLGVIEKRKPMRVLATIMMFYYGLWRIVARTYCKNLSCERDARIFTACKQKILNKSAAMWENVPSDMYTLRRLGQPTHSHSLISLFTGRIFIASLRFPHEEILHPWLSKCAQWRFWSDCANAQADLNFLWAHISESTFSDVAAQIDSSKHNFFFFFQVNWARKRFKISGPGVKLPVDRNMLLMRASWSTNQSIQIFNVAG